MCISLEQVQYTQTYLGALLFVLGKWWSDQRMPCQILKHLLWMEVICIEISCQ